MAKYSRYDARNKKNSRHKTQSLNRDIRIRRVEDEHKEKNRYHSFRKIDISEFFEEENTTD
jgi:hypothetical protein